jgi:hypothetical protein
MDTRQTRLLEIDGSPKIIRLQPSHSTGGGGGATPGRTEGCQLQIEIIIIIIIIINCN